MVDEHFEPRTYRQEMAAEGLVAFRVVVRETDLHIQAQRDLSDEARAEVLKVRKLLERHIAAHPEFGSSLKPVPVPGPVPPIVQSMLDAARRANVGPMASVAGAVAQHVGRALLRLSDEVIVENGGDIYMAMLRDSTIAVLAGKSPLSGKIGLRIPEGSRLGICTSSATVGPSWSAGRADAAVIVAEDAAFADAAASALGNRVARPDDVDDALAFIREVPGVLQALVVIGDRLGAWGQFELVQL